MKEKKILLLFLLVCWSCQLDGEQKFKLTGTQWKLMGFVYIETSEVKEPEPNVCEDCYTLRFSSDHKAVAKSITQELKLNVLDFSKNMTDEFRNPDKILRTEMYDGESYYDSFRFREAIALADSCIVTPDELRLYLRYRNYYLSFKPY